MFEAQKLWSIHILHLARTVIHKNNYRSQKARLVPLEKFPAWWTLMDEVFVFISGRWCCLRLRFAPSVESAVLESGACYDVHQLPVGAEKLRAQQGWWLWEALRGWMIQAFLLGLWIAVFWSTHNPTCVCLLTCNYLNFPLLWIVSPLLNYLWWCFRSLPEICNSASLLREFGLSTITFSALETPSGSFIISVPLWILSDSVSSICSLFHGFLRLFELLVGKTLSEVQHEGPLLTVPFIGHRVNSPLSLFPWMSSLF